MNDLNLFKTEFDLYLKNYLDKKIEVIKNYAKDALIIDYINHAKKIALMGGKRIRPFIAYLSYSAFGGKEKEKILKTLLSLETFHLFALIHDDIMDKDKLRHGILTSHMYISSRLKERGKKDNEYSGISQAILVGDLFFNWACEIISLNSENEVRKFFFEMVEGTIIGQMLDVDSQSRQKITPTLNSRINYLKTARYSFIYPLLIGASLSRELESDEKKFLEELGLNLGMAFQAQDDIFDSDNKKYIESQKKLIKNNMENGRKLIKESKIEKEYKGKFLELITTIEERKF